MVEWYGCNGYSYRTELMGVLVEVVLWCECLALDLCRAPGGEGWSWGNWIRVERVERVESRGRRREGVLG